jgi:hypothetical protein
VKKIRSEDVGVYIREASVRVGKWGTGSTRGSSEGRDNRVEVPGVRALTVLGEHVCEGGGENEVREILGTFQVGDDLGDLEFKGARGVARQGVKGV